MDFDISDDHGCCATRSASSLRLRSRRSPSELDRTKAFPYEIVRKLGELDLMGIPFEPEYGGAGGSTQDYAMVVEELTRVDSSVAITLCAHTSLGTQPIYLFGTEEQKQRYLPRLCSGEMLGAFGLTEPEAGSDAGNTQTRARLDGGEWVINGSKQFITNAGTEISGLVVITAVTGERRRGRRTRVPTAVRSRTSSWRTAPPATSQGEQYRKMGWHASDTRPLSFTDCRVPEENLVGGRGAACAQFLQVLDIGRIGVAAMGVGLAQGALDQALAYAKQRKAFGRPISSFQTIQAKLANLATEIEACRLLVQKAAWLKDQGRNFSLDRRAGEAQERPPGRARGRRGRPDPRRLRLHRGVPGVPLLPRREDPHDRRGHRRDPGARDRAGARRLTSCQSTFAVPVATYQPRAPTLVGPDWTAPRDQHAFTASAGSGRTRAAATNAETIASAASSPMRVADDAPVGLLHRRRARRHDRPVDRVELRDRLHPVGQQARLHHARRQERQRQLDEADGADHGLALAAEQADRVGQRRDRRRRAARRRSIIRITPITPPLKSAPRISARIDDQHRLDHHGNGRVGDAAGVERAAPDR